jgi:type II secretion system protein H
MALTAEKARTRTSATGNMTLTQTHRKGESAFTLIELMTVLVLIGIMTAMIIPEMRGTFEDALLRSTSRDLVNAFEIASSRAITLNQSVRVQLNTSDGHYLTERRVHEDSQEVFVPLKGVTGTEGQLDKRISIQVGSLEGESAGSSSESVPQNNGQTWAIAFNPDGTSDAAQILLQDRAGFRLALRINPITSRVSIYELKRE